MSHSVVEIKGEKRGRVWSYASFLFRRITFSYELVGHGGSGMEGTWERWSSPKKVES
jgi:hypothetical protein